MRELAPYLRLIGRHPGRLAAGMALMVATVACAAGLLAVSGWFITATALAGLTGAALGIYVPGAAIRTFALGRTVARYSERLYNHDTVLHLLADLRTRIFARLVPLDPATLSRLRPAERLNRFIADVDALDNLYLRALAPPAVALLAVAALGALLAWFAPAIAVAVTGLLASAIIGVGTLALALGGPLGDRIGRRVEDLRTRMIEGVQGLAELRCFGSLADHRARMDRTDRALTADRQRLARLAALGESALTLVVQLAAVLALFMGVGLYRAGAISGPVLALMPLVVLAVGEALTGLPAALLELGRTRAAARHLNEHRTARPQVRDTVRPARTPRRSDLALERVTLRYGPVAEPVLREASMSLSEHETVALVGPSGIGKSTVADLFARLLDPNAGRVSLGGVDFTRLRLSLLHERIAYLTQHTELFADTIAGNLRIARPDADEPAMRHALEVAGLEELVADLPAGLDTWVGENGMRLSGGQARRLALARVVLRNAPVVLLDEPLAQLDAATAAEVAGRLDAWLHGRTALLLGHRASAVPPADRILRINDGRFARA